MIPPRRASVANGPLLQTPWFVCLGRRAAGETGKRWPGPAAEASTDNPPPRAARQERHGRYDAGAQAARMDGMHGRPSGPRAPLYTAPMAPPLPAAIAAATSVPQGSGSLGHAFLLLGITALLLAVFFIGVVLLTRSHHRRHDEHPPTTPTPLRDAWREAGRRLEPPPPPGERDQESG